MGMLTSPFWLKLLWVLHLRLGMSTGAAQPLEEAQEPAQDLEAIANELHTQHYGPQSLATKCSWCLAVRQLQTIQHHIQFGGGGGELYLCSRCTVLWQLWEVLSFAPSGLEEYIISSVREFTIFWKGLCSALLAAAEQRI